MADTTPKLDELSHAEFDAHLVQTILPEYPWVTSTRGKSPFRTDDFVAYTKSKLKALLPQLNGYDTTRDAFTFAAFEAVHIALRKVHLRGGNLDELVLNFRRECLRCVGEHKMKTQSPKSPLWGHGIKQQSMGYDMHVLDLTSKHDERMFLALAGGHQSLENIQARERTKDMLAQIPTLSTLDTGHLSSHFSEWRRIMTEALSRAVSLDGVHATFDQSDTDLVVQTTMDAIADALPADLTTSLSVELAPLAYAQERRKELEQMSEREINVLAQKRRAHVRGPTKEDRIRAIIETERANSQIKKKSVRLDDPAPGEEEDTFIQRVIDQAYAPVLSQQPSPERDIALERRLALGEFHMGRLMQLMHEQNQKGDTLYAAAAQRQAMLGLMDDEGLPPLDPIEQARTDGSPGRAIDQLSKTLKTVYAQLGINHNWRSSSIFFSFISKAALRQRFSRAEMQELL